MGSRELFICTPDQSERIELKDKRKRAWNIPLLLECIDQTAKRRHSESEGRVVILRARMVPGCISLYSDGDRMGSRDAFHVQAREE